MNSSHSWHPTAAHARAALGGLGLAIAAVLARRPDLLVLGAPLMGAAVWGVVLRPSRSPVVAQFLDHSKLREGDATTWQIRVTDPEGKIEEVAAVFHTPAWIDQRPVHGQSVISLREDSDDQLGVVIRPIRWGRHRLHPALVVTTSGWNAFRFVSRDYSQSDYLLTLPQPAPFDAAAPAVRTPGLVGINRSPRQGGGTEFASVRLFQPGDKLRRIHWAQSLRTGAIHVTSTWADHDRHIVLLLDAFEDVGASGGIEGRASSLDIALRAAAAIAEHYTTTGDRVALLTMGASGVYRLPPAAGRSHLHRLLEVMATVEPANASFDNGRMPKGLSDSALVIVLSPLLSSSALTRLLTIARHGLNVLAIDCLPTDIACEDPDDAYAGITWRIEVLKRERRLRRVRAAGIAVVPWHGPGSLDSVLRGLHNGARVGSGRR